MSALETLAKRLAVILFTIGLLLSFIAVNWKVGTIPVRAIPIVSALLISAISLPSLFEKALHQNWKLILLITMIAILGVIVSLANSSALLPTLRQVLEIHVQAVIGLLLATLLVNSWSVKSFLLLFIGVWGLSAAVSLFQFADFAPAWSLREYLGDLMEDPAITRHFYETESRALGLSFSPVHLATQTCLAFAALVALGIFQTKRTIFTVWDWKMATGLLFAILVCVVSGNRSPLLGFAVFGIFYAASVAPRLLITGICVLIVLAIFGQPILSLIDQSSLRIAQTNDGSAIGRSTLSYFGILLIADRPMGYGLLFESSQLAHQYAHQIIHWPNPDIIKHFSLHNYYLQMLCKYGMLILLAVPLIVPTKAISWLGFIAFLPYMVHIGFHNDGPLSSDFLFWFLLPAVRETLNQASPSLKSAAVPAISSPAVKAGIA